MKLAKARTRLIRRHCRLGKVTRKHSTHANKGRVIKQSPKASRRKRRNAFKVNVTVGK
jgi:beta-lactam-binding protein with PASTA domain